MHKIHGWIGCEVWGIDQNMAGIEAARTQFPQYRFDWYEGDALPYADALFDAVMLNHVIGHVRNPYQSIHEITRILRPGGRVGIVTPNRNYKFCMLSSNLFNNYQPDPTVLRYYTVKSLNKLLTTAGFRIIESRYIGEFPRGFAFTHLKAIRFRVFTIGEKEE